MSNIRMPKSAEQFFEFVKNSDTAHPDHAFFQTYAHLLSSASAVGLATEDFDSECEFLEKSPRPISMDVFKNNKLDKILMLLAIAHARDPKVAKSEEEICRLIEGLASAGFREMLRMYEEAGGVHLWRNRWELYLLERSSVVGDQQL